MDMRFALRGVLPITIVFMMTVGAAYLPPMEFEDGPAILVVGEGGYVTINDAMKVARPNDIIRVGPGVYDEPVIIDKPITLAGSGPMTVYTSTLIVGTNGATVTGHTFIGIYNNATAHDWDFGGIVTRQVGGVNSDSYITGLTVSFCTFRNNRQGVFLFGAKNCVVTDNNFYGSYRGVSIGPHKIGTSVVWSSSGNTVKDNKFFNMVGTGIYDGEAVAIWESNSNTISGNTMDGNSYGVSVVDSVGNTITGNTITNSTYRPIVATSVNGPNSVTITGNTIMDNNQNILIDSSSQASITTNTFSDNGGPIELRGGSAHTLTQNTISDSSVFLNGTTGNTFISNAFATSDAQTFLFEGPATVYNENIGTTNTVGGRAIHYYYNDNNVNLADADVGSIMLIACDDAVITNTMVTDGDGIWVRGSPRASIQADLTNTLWGINVEGGTGVDVSGSSINTSTRGWYGMRLAGPTSGTITDSSVLAEGTAPAFLIEDDSDLSSYNTTFDGGDVDATDGLLSVYNYLGITVWDEGRLSPLVGAEVEVTEDDALVYATPHFGGTDDTVSATGVITDILLLDREYDHSNIATERIHNVTVWMEIDAVWSAGLQDIDMSGPLDLVFEATDIRAPATPMGFLVLDIPDFDAIEITWDANTDDTTIYSLYSNMTGDWALLENQTMTTYTISSGLVHGHNYWFAVSAWDDVLLESIWTNVAGVIHADALAPVAPSGLQATTITGTEIVMGWAANTEADLEGYNLYINSTGGDENGPWTLLAGDLTSLEFMAEVLQSETMYHFVLTAFDEVPNESPLSVVLSVMTLDITPPEAPVLDALSEWTNVEVLSVTGTAEPGSTVTVFLGAVEAATGVADGEGAFSIDVTLAEGPNLVTAWATDDSDNTGPLSIEGSINLDTVAPDAPEVDTIPELTNVVQLTISGTVEPLTTVTVTLNEVEILVLATDDNGDFDVTYDLAEGENQIVVFATDRATNIGPSEGFTIRLDTVLPVVDAGEDAEYIQGDESTLDGSDSSDDFGIDTIEWTFTDDGSSESLSGDIVKWTFNVVQTVTVTLTVTDLAGNVATDEVVLTILVRNGPPTLKDGTVTPDKGTTATEFTFEVTFTDPDSDTGEVIIYLDGQPYVMTPDPLDTDSSDGRTYTYTTKLDKGEHTYYFTGKDSLLQDATGPSAGEDKSSSTPDVSKKKTDSSPGPGAFMALAAVVIAIIVLDVRRRRT
jgi:parallel beta-helix repeat protein